VKKSIIVLLYYDQPIVFQMEDVSVLKHIYK